MTIQQYDEWFALCLDEQASKEWAIVKDNVPQEMWLTWGFMIEINRIDRRTNDQVLNPKLPLPTSTSTGTRTVHEML